MKKLILALMLMLVPVAAQATDTQAQIQAKLGKILGRIIAQKDLSTVMDNMECLQIFATAAQLAATTPSCGDGTIGYAIDTDVHYFRQNGAWVSTATLAALQNGATVTNAVDGTVVITEGGETETHTYTTDLITLGSSTSATYAFTPAVSFTGATTMNGVATFAGGIALTNTIVDFTNESWTPINAKTTLAVWTEADTQEDFFYVGKARRYFEFFQDGNNTINGNLFTPTATGWVLPGDNAADQAIQITEGIIANGSSKSFVSGTSPAFKVRATFLIATRAEIADLFVGFRKLGAYVIADDATEWATAYDDKAAIGIDGNAGAFKLMTSKATSDVTTACTHTAHVNGEYVTLEVDVSAAGITSHKIGTGTTAALALAALAPDTLCDAALITLTAATYVPTIEYAKAAGGISDVVLVNYYSGF